MTEIVDLDSESSGDERETSHNSVTTFVNKEAPKTNKAAIKKKGQLTFSDFKGIAIVKPQTTRPTGQGHKIKIKISENIPKVLEYTKTPKKVSIKPKTTMAALKRSQSTPDIDEIPLKRNACSELESQRYKILKTEHYKKVPGLKTLQNLTWTPNIPLMNDDFKDSDERINNLWMDEFSTMPKPHAKDIMKIMSFINKFGKFFDENLRNIRFEDFEIGLSIGTTEKIRDDAFEEEELERMKNLMNFLFYNLLELLFRPYDKKISYNIPIYDKFLHKKNPYGKMIGKLHSNVDEWGSPREWSYDFLQEKEFYEDDRIDESASTVDGPVFKLSDAKSLHPRLQDEYHPLFSITRAAIDINGLYEIDTFTNRVITLSYLVNLNLTYSPVIHEEVNKMTHNKKDQYYTHLVPNFLKEGFDQTIEDFTDLCESIVIYINTKRKVKYDRFKDMLPTLDKIRGSLVNIMKKDKFERRRKILEMYDDWVVLMNVIMPDNSLSDPYLEEPAKLRLQEFFVARVQDIGDFYVPRMNTYNNSNNVTNLYVDILSLLKLFKMYDEDEIDDRTIQKEFKKVTKARFSLFYRNSVKMTTDWFKKEDTSENNYWYLMCNDASSLRMFKLKIENLIKNSNSSKLSKMVQDADYQDTKTTLSILHDYLEKIYPIVEKIENVEVIIPESDTIDTPPEDGNISSRSGRGRSTKVNYRYQTEEEFDQDLNHESDADFVSGSQSAFEDDQQDMIPSEEEDVETKEEQAAKQKLSREERLLSRRQR
ncbi:hypothetical protein C6P45_001591 [Maudiozyma exigua]|uniref:WHIM1 domain-containing protein n=1 Tax=Maudiozyma exigua TaxID=34358 RepID=A0A9P6W0L2_MAUEX|nr:hypothetical protein C6P45_001591 [Kazachstania exigua]